MSVDSKMALIVFDAVILRIIAEGFHDIFAVISHASHQQLWGSGLCAGYEFFYDASNRF